MGQGEAAQQMRSANDKALLCLRAGQREVAAAILMQVSHGIALQISAWRCRLLASTCLCTSDHNCQWLPCCLCQRSQCEKQLCSIVI